MVTLRLTDKDFERLCETKTFGLLPINLFDECKDCEYSWKPSSCHYSINKCIKKHWGAEDSSGAIRCKDCEYWRQDYGLWDNVPYCELTATRTDPDFFCSGGERKGE